MSRTWSREGMTCVGTDRVLCTTIVSWQELSGSVQKLAHFGHPDSSLRRGHPPARHVKARALGSIRMARASSPVEFSEARRRMPGTADGADPLTTTEALFYDSDADTDDEFQARLAEAYRECSPSRQRRLAERSKNPSSFASYAMQDPPLGRTLVSIFPTPVGGPVDVNGCEHARAPVFPSVVQPPVFPNEVPFSVPAPPFAVPNLSQAPARPPRDAPAWLAEAGLLGPPSWNRLVGVRKWIHHLRWKASGGELARWGRDGVGSQRRPQKLDNAWAHEDAGQSKSCLS
ncbi:unnamed protein product [Prorocentrum cordatum]|uniref:Holocytochrome c-type synthase n=1 Tax=Prorocentrum cordatum TaxID=2364126 RepID=A0ABN9VFM4_9DINO|nr:unnamed protein product [Polarella glacialis]